MGAYLKITKTDTLLMEYVELPHADLSVRFLYRFREPVETLWEVGSFSLVQLLLLRTEEFSERTAKEAAIKSFGLTKWYDMLALAAKELKRDDDTSWLSNVSKVALCECHIVPL
jgi:hypothetical protein